MRVITINYCFKIKNIYHKTIYLSVRKKIKQEFYLPDTSKETEVTVDNAPSYTFPTKMITVL